MTVIDRGNRRTLLEAALLLEIETTPHASTVFDRNACTLMSGIVSRVW